MVRQNEVGDSILFVKKGNLEVCTNQVPVVALCPRSPPSWPTIAMVMLAHCMEHAPLDVADYL